MRKCNLCKKNVDTDNRSKQYYDIEGKVYCKSCGNKVAEILKKKPGFFVATLGWNPIVSVIGWPKHISGGLKRVK